MKKQRQSLLAVDIGNSTIGLGFYPDVSIGKPLFVAALQSSTKLSVETIDKFIHKLVCERSSPATCVGIGVIISSVVPNLNRKVIAAISAFCKVPLIIDYHMAKGLSFDVPHPEMIGTDRIVNVLAGFTLFNKPVAIIDFGTATTITVAGRQANFMGGAIMPGLDIMIKSLTCGTAKLPMVSLSRPRSVTGRDTASAITAGVIHGTAGAVDRIVGEIEKECHTKLRMILTGGRAAFVSPFLKKDHALEPHLIFEGMRLIFIRNAGNAGNNCVY
jgi:type III pantothenate kinase